LYERLDGFHNDHDGRDEHDVMLVWCVVFVVTVALVARPSARA